MERHKIRGFKATLPYFHAGKLDAPRHAGGVGCEFLQTQTLIVVDVVELGFNFVEFFLEPVFFFSLLTFEAHFLFQPHADSRYRAEQREKRVTDFAHHGDHGTGENQWSKYRGDTEF